MLLLIIVLILVFGVGGGAWYGPRAGWGGAQYGGGIGLIFFVLLILFLFGGLGHGFYR
jgi:hypothetical protein